MDGACAAVVKGQTVPNLVSVALGPDGAYIYNGSGGKANIVVDLRGRVPPLS